MMMEDEGADGGLSLQIAAMEADQKRTATVVAVYRKKLRSTVIDEARKQRAKLILAISKCEKTIMRLRERADQGNYPKSLRLPALTFPEFPTKVDFENREKILRANFERDSLALLLEAHTARLEYEKTEFDLFNGKLEAKLANSLANCDLANTDKNNLVLSLSAEFQLECAKLDAEAKCKADAAKAAAAEAERAKNAENARVEKMVGEEQSALISEIVRHNMTRMLAESEDRIVAKLAATFKSTLNTSGNSRPPRGSPSGRGGKSGNSGKRGKKGKGGNAPTSIPSATPPADPATQTQQKKSTEKKRKKQKTTRP